MFASFMTWNLGYCAYRVTDNMFVRFCGAVVTSPSTYLILSLLAHQFLFYLSFRS